MNDRLAYIILDTQKTEDGEFIPCVVKENESGYFVTDYHWGTDIKVAQRCARELNEKMGLTENDVIQILLSTMRSDKPFNPAV